MVVMCSWCNKVRQPDGSWLELDSAVEVMDLLSSSQPLGITHSICPSCRNEVNTRPPVA